VEGGGLTPTLGSLLSTAPAIDDAFLEATTLPWLLAERSGALLCSSPTLRVLLGWQTVPTGAQLSDFFSFDADRAWQSEGVWKQLVGNFTTVAGEMCRMECLSFCGGDRLLLLLEQAHSLLPLEAMSAMSKLNDELVNIARELQKKKAELERALARVRTLEGLLPICASCKKIRVSDDHWEPIESYIQRHTNASFTHGGCPACLQELYPDSPDEP
jgi:hypothetical protein